MATRTLYLWLADIVMLFHVMFIAWVVFGAAVTRERYWAARLHWVSLLYGVAITVPDLLIPGGIPCPLTLVENWFLQRAGATPYEGSFVAERLHAIVYLVKTYELPVWLMTAAATSVCLVNFGIYGARRTAQQRAT
jgi:hypothetical protein